MQEDISSDSQGIGNLNKSQSLYMAGVEAHARLQPNAVSFLFQSHSANSTNLRTIIVLSEIFHGMGDEKQTKHFNDLASSLLPFASADEVEFASTVSLLTLNNAELVANLFEDYIRRNPSETFIWTAIARFFGGGGIRNGRQRFLELCENVEGSTEPSDIIMSRRAYALHETNRLEEAETIANEALIMEPKNGSAIHSLLHVYYEMSRHEDGLSLASRWLSDFGESTMRSHLGWHAAIHAEALGDYNEARRILNTVILCPVSPRGITVDAPALIWRLHIRGEMVWTGIEWFGEYLTQVHFEMLTPLSAVFVAFGLTAVGKRQYLCEFANHCEESSDGRFLVAGTVARGLILWLDEKWSESEKKLQEAKQVRWSIGGSHIQQEIIDLTCKAIADKYTR